MRVGLSSCVWHADKSVLLDCRIGEGCTIHAPVWIGNNVVIGDHCKVQAFAFIPEGVKIGHKVFIGPHVCFTNDPIPPSTKWAETIVGDGVVIGARAVIKAGVTLFPGAKIGCGAVVTKDVPADGRWWVGNPARPLEA